MAYETITYETRGQIGILTLNRPDKLNAISAGLRRDLEAGLIAAQAGDGGRPRCAQAPERPPRPGRGSVPPPDSVAVRREWRSACRGD